MFLFNTFKKTEKKQQELEHLNKAIEMLYKNYEKKVVSSDYYLKKNQEFLKKKEKLEKQLNISKY